MKLTVHNTLDLLGPLFTEPLKPKARFERARPLFYEEDGLFRRLQGLTKAGVLYKVMQAGELDGYDAAYAQQAWGLFNPTRKLEASQWVFDRFAEVDVMTLLKGHLNDLLGHLPLSPSASELNAYLLPADPANRTLMLRSHGLSVYAGAPGVIIVQLWPSEGNLARLKLMLARGLIHSLGQPVDKARTLKDVLKLEGLASSFVREVASVAEPWLVAFRPPADWQAELARVAQLYGAPHYEAIRTNVYGSQGTSAALPEATPLTGEELAYASGVVGEALEESRPAKIAAYLYGDEVVAAQGHLGVGMPVFGGLEVAATTTELRATLANSPRSFFS